MDGNQNDRDKQRKPDRRHPRRRRRNERELEKGSAGRAEQDRNNDASRHRDHRGRGRRRRRRDYIRRSRPEIQGNYPACPICERDITSLSSAITYKESGTPAHFECVMKKILETENVSSNERLCYLGKGSFGIVRFQKASGHAPFVIRKRIQYEELEETPEWRKQLERVSRREQ
ncbi:MAG TPA: hypothetical protein ENN69_07480 [Spirochaetia bacterium]|nr:hypothetical protein [Spirochaetia bacterium]